MAPTAPYVVKKPTNMAATFKRIIKELIAYKWMMITVLVATILSTVLSIFGPAMLGQATTELFNGMMRQIEGTGAVDFEVIGRILLIAIGLYVGSALFGMLQGYIMSTVVENVVFKLRQQLLQKIHQMPMAYFESQPYGEVLSRLTNDIDTVANSLGQSVTQLMTALLTMVGVAAIMLSMNVILALVVLLLVPVSFLVMRIILKNSQKYFNLQQESLGVINGQVEEVYGGQTIVKAFNQEARTMTEFENVNQELESSAWKSQFFSGIMFPFMRFLGYLGYVAVVIIGAYMVIRGSLTVGGIQAFTQYVNRFTVPITQLSQIVTMLQTMAAAGERVFDLLDEEEESQTTGQSLVVDEVEGQVEFKQVSFGYQPNQRIIHNFSAQVNPGEKVALVGPTGAGKSTIVKLLMRFYDVKEGEIRVDGRPINEYSRQSYQQMMAMVLQDTWLYNDTIMENIRYGRQGASDDEVIQAAKSARVYHYIQQLPSGFDFVLNEEATNISQGQKQLLTIARAILADRPVLILDEATSSVDTRTEILIQEAMNNLMVGRTSFVIAHRLSTIRDSDLILYMEDGDIVEQGNHEELMDFAGCYANLYNSQFTTTLAS